MKNTLILASSLLISINLLAQTATSLTDLESPALDETSGLLYYNNNVITFNDIDGEPELYEIDLNTGAITRTVTITNASNIDWEDIAQDDDYIYIGDFGNNNGDRLDLKIYKISKLDYDSNDDMATADVINFTYSDQTDFSVNALTNFDAESLISYGNNLIVFSKNWGDNQVKAYSFPKTVGTHSAILESSFNSNGMITGADISADEKIIFLTGYSSSAAPFMYTIQNIPNNSLDIFSGTVSSKIENVVPFGNIVEGVCLFETTNSKYRLYLSNEKFIATAGPISVPFPAKLWLIEIEDESLNTANNKLESIVDVYPNPVENKLNFSQSVDEVSIFDAYGKLILIKYNVNEILFESFNSGVYFVKMKVSNSLVVKKIIKK